MELKRTCFSGVETAVYDSNDDYHVNFNLVSRPIEIQEPNHSRITLLHREERLTTSVLEITKIFEEAGYGIDHCTLHQTAPLPGQDIVSLLDLDTPMFDKISAAELRSFQLLVKGLEGRTLLWVTQSSQMECNNPAFGLIIGLSRTLRLEQLVRFATLELDCLDANARQSILDVFKEVQTRKETAELDQDWEFALSKGTVHISRYHPIGVKDELAALSNDAQALVLNIGTRGLLQTLKWGALSLHPTLGENEVIVDSRCVGLNFKVSVGSHTFWTKLTWTLGYSWNHEHSRY